MVSLLCAASFAELYLQSGPNCRLLSSCFNYQNRVSISFSLQLSCIAELLGFAWQSLVNKVRLIGLPRSVAWLHGPKAIATTPTDAIVLCVLKDSENLVEAFIEHYLHLGFKHLFFLDNGSSDRTIERIRAHPHTTIVRSTKPFRDYYVVFKNYLIQTFGAGHWCLIADVDEFLHLPLKQPLNKTLQYLNANSYNVVCVQMLDVFSEEGVVLEKSDRIWSLSQLQETFKYYDVSDVSYRPYVRSFQPHVPQGLRFAYGGIRQSVFNRNCFLTKEALLFIDEDHSFTWRKWAFGLGHLQSSHLLFSLPKNPIRLGDLSALFVHYKFIDSFYAATQEAVVRENHWRGSQEYKAYQQVLVEHESEQKPQGKQQTLNLKRSTAHVLDNVDKLIDQGFLFVSDIFKREAQER